MAHRRADRGIHPEFEADREEARARARASAQGPGPGNVAVEAAKVAMD
jgi:hypothetical protein